MDREEKLCNNCNLYIAAQNHVIHELHCTRHVELCDKCKTPIAKEKMTEHLLGEHTDVNCQHCDVLIEKSILQHHIETDCPKKLLACSFCELELPACNMNKHTEYCGTRTEQCPECKEIVMIKYKTLHLDSNHAFLKLDDEPGPVASWSKEANSAKINETQRGNKEILLPCEFCNEMLTAKELKRHEVSCFHGWQTTVPLLRQMSINTCDICNKPVASKEYETHRIICSELPTCSQTVKDNMAHKETDLIPCDICKDSIPFAKYERHQRKCIQRQERSESTHKSDERRSRTRTKSREELRLPCKKCRRSISLTDYVEHCVTCCGPSVESNSRYFSLTKVACKYCEEEFNSREIYNHVKHCPHKNITPELIPCEFCQLLKSKSEILEHQLNCKAVNDY